MGKIMTAAAGAIADCLPKTGPHGAPANKTLESHIYPTHKQQQ